MAGMTLRAAHAPQSPASLPAPHSAPQRSPASTRTRRNHGVFLIGSETAAVFSSRRAADGHGVSMTVGNGPFTLMGSMTPTHARLMARALVAAAAAAESAGEKGCSGGKQ